MKFPDSMIETERRFHVTSLPDPVVLVGDLQQGYLLAMRWLELRVRAGAEHSLALKVARGYGSRFELETTIPEHLARLLFGLSRWKILKSRWVWFDGDQRWDIDCYHGKLDGLRTAEAETSALEDLQIPQWVGSELTGDRSWSNRSLARYGHPEA